MQTVKTEIRNTSGGDLIVLDGTVRLGPGSLLSAGTEYEAPIYIADNAKVLTGVSIGRYSYLGRNSIVTKTEIGRYCSIAHDCQINYFRAHPKDWLSTHPFQFDSTIFSFWPEYTEGNKVPFPGADESQSRVTIGHDVWLSADVHIFGGVTIGTGAIVGSRSMIRRDVEPYSIVAGSPAKVISERFDPETKARLLASRWWEKRHEDIAGLPFSDPIECLNRL